MRDIKINIENLLIGEKKIITNTDFIISSNKKYGGENNLKIIFPA